MSPHLLFIGGEDHDLRLPFMVKFRERGYRVTAMSSGSDRPFRRAGIAFRRFDFERFVNPLADWRALGAIRAHVAGINPDLVQCFDTKLNILVPIALRRLAVPVVRTLNGRGWLYSSKAPSALVLRPIYRGLHAIAARSTEGNVFEHEEDERFFARGGMSGRDTRHVIPGAGIDVEGFDRDVARGEDLATLREALGIGDAKVIMTVTRMTRQKGIGSLLEAAAEVHRRCPDVRFLLVGPRESEGPLAISQAELDRHAPYVVATGPRTDVPSLLRFADVFAFPTEYREGIPRALLEAAIAGIPIVTTNMPGCREVVKDGYSGFVVEPHSPGRLAARILDLLHDRQTALTMAARAGAPVREKYSLVAVVEGYQALYDDLISQQLKDYTPPSRRRDAQPWRVA